MSVCIISRNTIFREAIALTCSDKGMEVCCTRDCAPQPNSDCRVELVLWHFTADDRAPGADVRSLVSNYPEARIVVLAPQVLCGMLEDDCAGLLSAVIPESCATDAVVSVLLLAQQGYNVHRAAAAPPRLLAANDSTTPQPEQEGMPDDPGQPSGRSEILSDREAAVLSYLRAGYSNKSIARALGICDATVKSHLRSSFHRIGATNRTQAAIWASKHL
jgi:two-component system, NarL family, nitrate/nitrite response regulator NarL